MGAPVLHAYVYSVVPPVTDTVAVPSQSPLHVTSVEEIAAERREGSVTGIAIVSSQPVASVIITE